MKKALITGITGQDGAYLAALFVYEGLQSKMPNKEIYFLKCYV